MAKLKTKGPALRKWFSSRSLMVMIISLSLFFAVTTEKPGRAYSSFLDQSLLSLMSKSSSANSW